MNRNLVPKYELCKLIPIGEFRNSSFSWCMTWNEHPKELFGDTIVAFRSVVRTKDGFCVMKEKPDAEFIEWKNEVFPYSHICSEYFPAPTLEEIMAALPACQCYRLGNEWTVALANDSIKNAVKSENPTTAALKLWLKLKGIEA